MYNKYVVIITIIIVILCVIGICSFVSKRAEDATNSIGGYSPNNFVDNNCIIIEDDLKGYNCCVSPEDIVFVFNRYWMVTDVKEVSRFRPQKLGFYYCELKSLKGMQNV